MKQSKLRKRRVWRYAMMYFLMLIIFIALLVGPIFIGKIKTLNIAKSLPAVAKYIQPTGLNNNDTTNRNETGTGCKTCSTAANTAASTSGVSNRVRLF
jgi:1,3-beta-glucan synthase